MKLLELDKNFDNKEDLFKALKENKADLISIKKSLILKSAEKGNIISSKLIDKRNLDLSTEKSEAFNDDNYYYIAVNSCNILDSHKDLHVNGIWDKSAKEQNGRNYLALDHRLQIDTIGARKENVEMFVANLPFKSIGETEYLGNTDILIYKVAKDKIINTAAKEWLDSGAEIQASVRMQYVNIELCMNSTAKEDKAEKKAFDKYYPLIANKDAFAEEIYYFWAVREAKNVTESSLVVLGSNPSTGILIKAAESTLKTIEPSNDTRKFNIINYL